MQTRKVVTVAALLGVFLWAAAALVAARREGLDTRERGTRERGTRQVAPRQAGGRIAVRGRYPYIVQFSDREGPYCTGFLISPIHVLTAAHCMSGKKLSDIKMRIGVHTKFGIDGETRAPKSVYIPPQYKDDSSRKDSYDFDDYALVTLWTPSTKTPIKVDGFNADVSSKFGAGTEVWSAGFGRKMFGFNPKLLQENALRLTKTTTSMLYSFTDEKKAGFESNYRRPCGGDSGAPIMLRGKTAADDVAIGLHILGSQDENGQCNPEVKGDSKHVRTSWIMGTSKIRRALGI